MTMAIYRVSLTLKRLCLMTLSLTIRYMLCVVWDHAFCQIRRERKAFPPLAFIRRPHVTFLVDMTVVLRLRRESK